MGVNLFDGPVPRRAKTKTPRLAVRMPETDQLQTNGTAGLDLICAVHRIGSPFHILSPLRLHTLSQNKEQTKGKRKAERMSSSNRKEKKNKEKKRETANAFGLHWGITYCCFPRAAAFCHVSLTAFFPSLISTVSRTAMSRRDLYANGMYDGTRY